MKRTELRRSAPPKRRTRLRARNPERRKREWARAYGSEECVRWTRRQPSVVSGRRPCVNAHVSPDHVPPSGMGRKGDACWIVPLTSAEHSELHQLGQRSFEAKHGVDLTLEAMDHDSRWRGR